MNVTIKVEGLDELKRDLEPKTLEPFLVKAGKKATTIVRNFLRKYPPRRRSSRRTGRLGRGWKAQVSSTGRTARVVNAERYAHIVQGSQAAQPWYKDVGWIQAESLPENRRIVDQVQDAYQEELDAWAKDVG